MLPTLVLSALLAGQVAEPLPPPPPLESDELIEPLVDDAVPPGAEDDEPAPRRPLPAPPSSPGIVLDDEPPPPPPEGLDAFATGGLQVASGCVATVATGACASLLVVLPAGPCLSGALLCVGLPVIVGTTETVVGNLVGARRGALLWPVLAAGGSLGLGALATLGAYLTVMVAATSGIPMSGAAASGLALVALGALVLTAVAVPLLPAFAYGLTAEPRQPGQDEGFPDVLPPGLLATEAPPQPAPLAGAMRY